MDDGEMNIKQIVGRLSNPDRKRKGDFRLSFRKAEIENMELCLDRREGANANTASTSRTCIWTA